MNLPLSEGLSAIFGSGVTMGFMRIILGGYSKRMDKLEKEKVDVTLHDEVYKKVDENLKKIDKTLTGDDGRGGIVREITENSLILKQIADKINET